MVDRSYIRLWIEEVVRNATCDNSNRFRRHELDREKRDGNDYNRRLRAQNAARNGYWRVRSGGRRFTNHVRRNSGR